MTEGELADASSALRSKVYQGNGRYRDAFDTEWIATLATQVKALEAAQQSSTRAMALHATTPLQTMRLTSIVNRLTHASAVYGSSGDPTALKELNDAEEAFALRIKDLKDVVEQSSMEPGLKSKIARLW